VPDSIRWYMDEHVPIAVTAGLHRRGMDVLTTQDAGMLGADDNTQLAYTTSQARVIFTQDDDFLRLAATDITHAGIVGDTEITGMEIGGADLRALRTVG
jgi:predicted nuclease of predicted toxin-antitoxin system